MAVVGVVGVGKTNLKQHFLCSVLDQRPDISVFWVSAASADTWRLRYAEVAKEVGVDLKAERENDEWKLHRLQAHISSKRGDKWLLVVDNADDFDLFGSSGNGYGIIENAPKTTSGRTLLTTRDSQTIQSVADCETLELAEMKPVDAMALLEDTLANKVLTDERSRVKELLNELDYLPFAIAQAAACMNFGKSSISEFLSALRNSRSNVASVMTKELLNHTGSGQSAYSIARTSLVSFDQILKIHPLAVELLQFISCIGWEAIPRYIIPSKFAKSISVLCSCSLLTPRKDQNVLDMHQLTHLAVRSWVCHGRSLAETRTEALRHLQNICTSDLWDNGGDWRTLMPHLAEIHNLPKETDLCIQGELYLSVGRILYADGRLDEGARWLDGSRDLATRDATNKLSSRGSLSSMEMAQPNRAIELLEDLLDVQSRVWGDYHPHTLSSQHSLALAYQVNGQLEVAATFLKKVVEIKVVTFGKHSPSTLSSQHTLALAYQAKGRPKKAEKLLEKVVETQTEVFGSKHPHTLTSQTSLALVCQANGRHKKAIQILESVVATHAMVLTKHHPQLISSQHSLALAYQANGQAAEATRLMLLNQVTAEQRLSPLKTFGPIETSMFDKVNGMDNAASGTATLDEASWLSMSTHMSTHMRRTNDTTNALNTEGYEQKAKTLLGKSAETVATYTTSTVAASSPISATLTAVGTIGIAIVQAAKLFRVDKRLSESERDKAYAEMQKALESKMNVISSELQNSLKLLEETVAHTERDLGRRSSTIAKIEARWLEKNERLQQDQKQLDNEIREHQMAKQPRRNKLIAKLEATIARLEQTIDQNSESLRLKTKELQDCNETVANLRNAVSCTDQISRERSDSLARLGTELRERDETIARLEMSISCSDQASREQAGLLARKAQELEDRDQVISTLKKAAKHTDQKWRDQAKLLAYKIQEVHDRDEKLARLGALAKFLLSFRKSDINGNSLVDAGSHQNGDDQTCFLDTCGLVFGYRKQKELSKSDSDIAEKPHDQSDAAFMRSQVAA